MTTDNAPLEETDKTNTDNEQTRQTISYENLRRRSVTLFMMLSIIAVTLVGLLVGTLIARVVRQQMIESYALSTATQAGGTVNTFVDLDDLKQPFKGKKYTEFRDRITQAVAGTNVVKVKLWRPDGTVVFSNDREIVGQKFSGKEHLEEALTGNPSYEISDLKADENVRERSEFNRLLELYYPVYLDKNNPESVSAVYEVYMSVLPLEQYVASVMRNLALGLTGLVVLLIIIAQIASRMLRHRNLDLAELSAKLEKRADTDGLTGLFNHRHFQSRLQQVLSVSSRYNHKMSLIIIDLDFFKSVNDRFGHQVGDEVLRKVAGIFDDVLRDADYAARYGGEEFVAILPETDAKGAVQVAERLREAAESLLIDVSGAIERPRVTLSCGVADYPSCADSGESLIAAADSALLFAKRNGRNRVYYFREISTTEFQQGDLEKLVSRLQHASMPTIQALVAAVDANNSDDSQHSQKLGSLVDRFASKLRLQENYAHSLKLAAEVHDVGKALIPGRVLEKTEALTDEEVEAIRSHPEAGAKIVESAAQMETLLSAVLHHHENWDGSGYPNGLKGEEIPYLARILRIADAYGAMISDRPYRTALSCEEALREIRTKAGSEFDPQLVEVFVEELAEQADAPEQGVALTAGGATAGKEPAPA